MEKYLDILFLIIKKVLFIKKKIKEAEKTGTKES